MMRGAWTHLLCALSSKVPRCQLCPAVFLQLAPATNRLVELLKPVSRRIGSCYNLFRGFSGLPGDGRFDGTVAALEQQAYVSNHIFYHLLQRCIKDANVVRGRKVHALIVRHGLGSNCVLGHQLVCMYASCGSLLEAQQVFLKLPCPDNFVWLAIISAHCKHGQAEESIELYTKMRMSGAQPDDHVYVAVLKACASVAALTSGKLVHGDIIRSGMETNVFVGSALVDMYFKCGSLKEARKAFNKLSTKDLVIWNVMIAGYAQHGFVHETFQLFENMQEQGLQPDRRTLVMMLKVCSSVAALDQGRVFHDLIVKRQFDTDVFIGTTLVDMYAKCGSLTDARMVFDQMHNKNLVSWNTMLAGYALQKKGQDALTLFQQMQEAGIQPNQRTLVTILKACSGVAALDHGKAIHALIMEAGMQPDVFVISSLIDMYANCGNLEDALQVFNSVSTTDVVIWNAMIAACSQHGCEEQAFRLYQQMQHEGLQPCERTLVSLLNACSRSEALDQGKLFHALARERGYLLDKFVAVALVDMYAKCGSLDDARHVFDGLPQTDPVSWTAMITGYVQEGNGPAALELFPHMWGKGMQPDEGTVVTMLKACCMVAALSEGRLLHAYILDAGLISSIIICCGLIDMYAKCGSLKDARRVFGGLPNPGLVSWNSLIAGYAHHGRAQEALESFQEMQRSGTRPNTVTFVSLLSACSHAGLLDEGRGLFRCMVEQFRIPPDLKHYACMIDLLGRAGCLDEAAYFLTTMTLQPNIVMWKSLLSACRNHRDVRLGKLAFERILTLDNSVSAAYILMSDLYLVAGMFEEEAAVRRLMQTAGVVKEPGRAWIESETQVHRFVCQDQDHPDGKHIQDEVQRLSLALLNDRQQIASS